MTKVEQVARAIRAVDIEPDAQWSELTDEERGWIARAAIEAMRHIESRSLALIMHDIDHLRGPMRESNSTFRTFWETAIDTALEEGEDE